MSEVRIARLISRRSRNHPAHWSSEARRPAGVTKTPQQNGADEARWLDGQVRGWTASRSL
jgi:hypothetical protein